MSLENDIKVRVGKEDLYLIEFPVGDWSDDGHGKCHYYTVKSKKQVQDVREAHFRASEVLGFDLGDICKNYEERTLDQRISNKLFELGYDFSTFDDRDEEGEPEWLSSNEVIDIWLYLLNHIDPSLKLEPMRIPSINFYGYDNEKRHLETPGYGVF